MKPRPFSPLILIETTAFLLLLLFFAAAELIHFLQDLSLSPLLALLQKVMVIGLVFVRSDAIEIDRSPFAWLVVFFSTFGMSFFSDPAYPQYIWLGELIRCVALLWIMMSLLSLGKNFGMLPAYRGLSQRGTYRWVRHPYSLGVIFLTLGHAIPRFSVQTTFFFLVVVGSLWLRLQREEKLLLQRSEYQKYCERVQYRLFYGLY